MAHKTAISSNKKSTIEKPISKSETTESNESSVSPIAATKYDAFCSKLKKTPLAGAMVAEFIGTFLLIASVFAVQGQPLYVAFALVGIVLLVGATSGAYVNPAMAIGAWVTRKIKGAYALGYIVAEVLGAAAAYLTLNTFLHGVATSTSTSTMFHAATITAGKEWSFFFAELIGAIVLALGLSVVVRVKKANLTAAFSYGLAILIALLIAGWVTSSSLTVANTSLSFINPALAIAANGVSWNIWPIAVYIIAPAIGGVIGFAIQDFLNSQTDETSCDCDCCDIK